MTGVFEVDWESGDVICVCGCNGVVVLVVVNLVPIVLKKLEKREKVSVNKIKYYDEDNKGIMKMIVRHSSATTLLHQLSGTKVLR